MAMAESKASVKVILTLSEEEAKYVKSLVQNFMAATEFEEEDPRHRELREDIWDALNEEV